MLNTSRRLQMAFYNCFLESAPCIRQEQHQHREDFQTPASMSKIITSFAGFVKLPKFIMGPTCARPGPMLFKVAAMAVKFVTISKPSRLMSRKETTKMKKYAPINTLVVRMVSWLSSLPSMRTGPPPAGAVPA